MIGLGLGLGLGIGTKGYLNHHFSRLVEDATLQLMKQRHVVLLAQIQHEVFTTRVVFQQVRAIRVSLEQVWDGLVVKVGTPLSRLERTPVHTNFAVTHVVGLTTWQYMWVHE